MKFTYKYTMDGDDDVYYIGEYDSRSIHNPNGLGWKHHGPDGRFTKKPVKDYSTEFAWALWVIICLLGFIIWFVNEATKTQYPI